MTPHQNVNFQSFFKEIRLIDLFDDVMKGIKNYVNSDKKDLKIYILMLFFIYSVKIGQIVDSFCKNAILLNKWEMNKCIETKL